ncbi:aquaporin TIP1-3-like [Lycium ferocissimum]|uniref:aquaporin TIP1-3-like n=1 Tax=Lycium ferocissimum TaxID=112874 RepID=UPI00281697CD|nr:aquaporin TIP1-3-like [Lycium ferocissimum]
MPISKIAIGNFREITKHDALKAALAEFICVITFVFPAEGCALVFSKMITTGDPANGLISASISHAFALLTAVSVGANISGGHASPAVTFGAFVGGHITFFRSVMYCIAQLLGSVVACYLLKIATNGLEVSPYPPQLPWNAVVFEIVMTFLLVYTYYATSFDPKKGNMGIISPIAIGLIVGANILCGGALFGAAMNPAIAFGQAMISGIWTHHWVYWLGNFVGAAIAALVYELIFIGENVYEQLPITNH